MHIRKFSIAFIAISLSAVSCQTGVADQKEKAKQEIKMAEKEFEKMAAEKGIAEAFWFFADSIAVIKRENDTLITGKENIKKYYSAEYFKSASVKWSPDYTDAADKGDMGYTYGKYVWQSKDSTGNTNEARGVFHTVWRKQADGSWKYVWD